MSHPDGQKAAFLAEAGLNMVSSDLKRELIQAWLEYEEAVRRAFGLPATAHMDAEGLENLLRAGTDHDARTRIECLRRQTQEFRSMKFVGEK